MKSRENTPSFEFTIQASIMVSDFTSRGIEKRLLRDNCDLAECDITLIFPEKYLLEISEKSERAMPSSPNGTKKAFNGSRDNETPSSGESGSKPSERNSKATSRELNSTAFSSLFSSSALSLTIS